jgi:tRNA A37 methylthiotransferase MiaB
MPQVAKQLRKKRAAMLREAGNTQLELHYNQKVGTVMSAICESENRARAEDFSLIKLDSPATGEVKVKITDADGCNHLIGEVV